MAVEILEYEVLFDEGITSRHAASRDKVYIDTLAHGMVGDDKESGFKNLPLYSKTTYTLGSDTTFTGMAFTQDIAAVSRDLYLGTEDGVFRVRKGVGAGQTTIKSGLAATTHISMVPFGGDWYFFPNNATDLAFNSAGTDLGLTRPTVSSGITISSGTGDNNVKGVVKYYISYMTGTTEGALSALAGTHDAGDGDTVDIEFDPVTQSEFDSKTIRIYRTYANGAQPYFVGQQAVASVAVTFTDDVKDQDLGDYPLYHGDTPPKNPASVVVYLDRAWMVVGNVLYWSDVGKIDSWWTTADGNQIDVFSDDGDTCVVLIRDENSLIIAKKNHFYRLSGDTSDTFRIREMTISDPSLKNLGIPHIWAVDFVPGGFVFYHDDRVILYSGGTFTDISKDLEADLRGQNAGAAARVGYNSLTDQVWIHDGTNTYIYSLHDRRWLGVTATTVKKFLRGYDLTNHNTPRFLIFDDTSALDVKEVDTGSTAFGTAVATLSPFWGGRRNALKRLVYIDVTAQNNIGNITADVYLDNNTSSPAVSAAAVPSDSVGLARSRLGVGFFNEEARLKLTLPADSGGNEVRVESVIFGYQIFPGVAK